LQLVVVDIRDYLAEAAQTTIGLIRALHCLTGGLPCLVGLIHGVTGVLIGRERMLVRGGSFLLHGVDPALRFLINLFYLVLGVVNCLVVSAGLLAHLIQFCLDRGGGVADVFVSCASGTQQSSCGDTSGG
jgi:hypothetical protein